MKGKTLSAIGLVMLAVGVALMIFYTVVNSSNIVTGAGIAFAAVGVINLILIASSHKAGSVARVFTQLANGGAIILGICMIAFKTVFMPLIPFIFGVVAAVCAVWQFFMLAMGTQPYRMPGWLYVFPLVITGLAVWIFIARTDVATDESLLTLLTGCALALTGLGSIIEGSILGHQRRKAEQETKQLASQQSAAHAEAPKAETPKEEAPKEEIPKAEVSQSAPDQSAK